MIKGLIFDFDGLVIDSEGAEYQAWQELFGRYGRELPLSVWSQAIGAAVDHFDALGYLESLLGQPLEERESLQSWRRQRYLELAQAQPVLPGVRELIVEAREAGLRLGVASNSSRRWVVGHLTRLELVQSFDCIITMEDVELVKPHPALYLAAVEALGLKPEEAIAFEDSRNGVTAAKAAGLFCVAVLNPLTNKLPLGRADFTLTSLAGVSLAQLVALAEGASNGRRAMSED